MRRPGGTSFAQESGPITPLIESFNGSTGDECLNTNWFMSLDEARKKIETSR
jgi:hypothetical protein